jgi:hypothetical protein
VVKVTGGGTCIIGLDRCQLIENLSEAEEGFVMADLDMDKMTKAEAMLHSHGHYSRPDLL